MLTLSWDEKAGSSDTSISSNPNSKDLKQSLAGQISIPLMILFSRHARWNICEHGRIVNGCFIMLKNNFEDSVAKDLRKTYSANHWEAVRGLFQLLGFTGIDDKRILSDDQVKLAFGTSQIPDLKSAIKAINAIVSNWCGYTIKSKRKLVGSKGQQIWKYSYQINRKPYKGCGYDGRGFNNQEEVMARKLDNPEYCPIAPILPSYKPKISNKIQDLFDSIPITNNTTSECTKHRLSDLSSSAVYEKDLSLEMQTQNQLIDSDKKDPSQGICHGDTTIGEASTVEKKISESLVTLCSPPAISLSSEYLIKNESDIDALVLLLQQKIQISPEKLKQWKTKIAFEMRNNQNYWKKERESITISLSSEYLIKNESDIDALVLLLQQKIQISPEKLKQWKTKIAFEMRNNQNYWKKERESISEGDFLYQEIFYIGGYCNNFVFKDYKQKFEAKLDIPTTQHKKKLKTRSLALIEYA
ncbi:hypothetical protein Glove_193g47 [Diversispora epigaea]|uniref:Uncharacterized protein n=1 Tax=Diversispora epigaea TaxID=1348612 RepID=A0A397IP74_9GLOM|nr:hypothetical protein Glove_193g47 [Diversispora epigaea]